MTQKYTQKPDSRQQETVRPEPSRRAASQPGAQRRMAPPREVHLRTRPDPAPQRRTAPRPEEAQPKTTQHSTPPRKRRRKTQWTRLLIYLLLALLAVLLVLALISLGKKILRDREERAEEKALQEEREHATLYDGADVLHLSFPVLTLENSENVPLGSGLTVSEFKTILQDLYDRGYVLVDLYSLTEHATEGYQDTIVMVPEGKRPLVLSQYGVQYSAEENGHADALIRTSGGEILASYRNDNGARMNGAVDVVPILEAFVQEHPDFSYKGARGILGVTGAEGLFGYQIKKDENVLSQFPIEEVGAAGVAETEPEDAAVTDAADDTEAEETAEVAEDETPETDAEGTPENGVELLGETGAEATSAEEAEASDAAERETAVEGTTESDRILRENRETIQAILGSLRSGGWHIASNGFDGVSYGSDLSLVEEDAKAWQEDVGALVGTTDILLIPGKADLGKWSGYDTNDEKVKLLMDLGFRQFCAEDDGALTWMQVRPTYVRQGIHSIDTYATYTALWGAE